MAHVAKDGAPRTANNLEQTARKAEHNLRDIAEDAGHTLREFFDHKSDQANEMRKQAEHRITSHPLQSVAIAAVAGLVLGALLRR